MAPADGPASGPSISGHTRVAGVVGNPVEHSLSPIIHNAAFSHLELDWAYVAFPVTDGTGIVSAMRTLGVRGLSVTMPHKEAAAAGAHHQTEAVSRLGVANTLWLDDDGRVWADSTDGDGFVAAYEADFGRSLQGLVVGIVGAGGAARAIVEAVGRAGAKSVLVANRNEKAATEAAGLTEVGRTVTVADLAQADVVVNATSVGMAGGPAPNASPFPDGIIGAHHDVVDIVYAPRRTPLVAQADRCGARRSDGLSMLVFQAGLQFQRWTGHSAPIETMKRAVAQALAAP